MSECQQTQPANPVQRILVADDSEPMRLIIADFLPSVGYAVTTASDGHAALEELGRCKADLVLLDIEMPGIDGCEVCRRIKSQPETRSVRVMLVSGRPDTPNCAAIAGADGFLQKPFYLDDLVGRIRSLLGPAEVPTTVSV